MRACVMLPHYATAFLCSVVSSGNIEEIVMGSKESKKLSETSVLPIHFYISN